jgi:hypothetical protein
MSLAGDIPMNDRPRFEYFKAILDAIPSPVFVVDSDVRIIEFNEAAAPLLGQNPSVALHLRGGEALKCLHASDSEEGCGRGPSCGECVIRNSVAHTFGGRKISRRTTRMDLVRNAVTREIYVLVTTSPFVYEDKSYALLILEDISELMDLRKVIPMCASCKRIRDDQEYWDHVENYFKKQLDIDFSHGICPECVKKLYPDLYVKLPPREKVMGGEGSPPASKPSTRNLTPS